MLAVMSSAAANTEYLLVDDDATLARAVELFAVAPWLALAVELNATRGYRPRICLVQVNAGGQLVALDPLAFEGRRPDPLTAALVRVAGGTPVIVHGGEYALAALQRELHVNLGNASRSDGASTLVDTQQAAVLLGLPATGLRALCSSLLGVTLPAPQSVDWSMRPLVPALIAHALSDVAHLGALHDALLTRIRAADLTDELALASAPPPPRAFVTPDTPDPRRYRRMPGASALPPEGLHLLGALVRWRDLKAKELDVPPGRLLPNAQLVDLAHAPERALQRLAGMRFHSRLVHADLEALRRTVALALATEPQDDAPEISPTRPAGVPATPKKGPPTPAIKARIARLKAWRRTEADARAVGLQAVLPLVALEHLAYFPHTPLLDVPALGRRRRERYAEVIASLL